MIQSKAGSFMIESAESSVVVVQSSTIMFFAFSFVFGPAILYLIWMLGSIQIVLHIPLMSVRVAANTIFFYKIIIPIVNYDVLSHIDMYDNFVTDISRGPVPKGFESTVSAQT